MDQTSATPGHKRSMEFTQRSASCTNVQQQISYSADNFSSALYYIYLRQGGYDFISVSSLVCLSSSSSPACQRIRDLLTYLHVYLNQTTKTIENRKY